MGHPRQGPGRGKRRGSGIACVCELAITHAIEDGCYPEVDRGVLPAVVAPWLVKKVGAGSAA